MIEVHICFTFGEAPTNEITIDPGVPSTRCLFETVQCLIEYSHRRLPIKCLKSFWLFYLHFLLNNTIEEFCFYILGGSSTPFGNLMQELTKRMNNLVWEQSFPHS